MKKGADCIYRKHRFGGIEKLSISNAAGFCGHKRKPPIEEAIKKLCNQFG